MTKSNYRTATKEDLLEWIKLGLLKVEESEDGDIAVFKWVRVKIKDPDNIDGFYFDWQWVELTQRINKRNRSNKGSYRVDIRFNNQRISVHVSTINWMQQTQSVIPEGWEIHHRNEDPTDDRFCNLICLHPVDHLKFHQPNPEVPF